MKQKFKHILHIGTALFLLLCSLLGMALPAGAADVSTPDFRLPGASSEARIEGDSLYQALFGEAPPTTVAAYLCSEERYTLRYQDHIPVDIIGLEYKGEWGELKVTVPAYTYTAVNGMTVSWIPAYVTRGDVRADFVASGEAYIAVFDQLFHTEDFDIDVHFTWQAKMTPEIMDNLLYGPWREGNAALELIRAYERDQLHPYEAALLKYETYQAFLSAAADREQYLSDMEEYRKKLALYEAYVAEYDAYADQLSRHEAWEQYRVDLQHYKDYQDFLVNDLKNFEAYMIYRNQVDQVNEKLEILESTFTADSHGWRLYASLMGGTVDTVLRRKDELVAGGCDAATIDKAGEATVSLRALMQGYKTLHDAEYSSEHERTKALYAYYTANYSALKESYRMLYEALFDLGNNSIVSLVLIDSGKMDHYIQFVGQLYVTYSALDDQHGRFSDWKFRNHTLSQAVEATQLIPDRGDAAPGNVIMPEKEVPAVESVEPIGRPTEPSYTDPGHPGKAPAVVEKPVEPTFVAEPDLSNPPPVATHPGDPPAPPAVSEELWALAEAIRAGDVTEPGAALLQKNDTLPLSASVECPVSIENKKTVRFYDVDRTTVLYETRVDYGGSVTYLGPAMAKDDVYNTYTFLGWVNGDGSHASYQSVTTNLFLYANYRVVPKRYTVTWILDGTVKTQALSWGDTPVCPFSLTRPATESNEYVFSGWDKEIQPVTGDVTYVGSIKAVPRTYTVTWVTREESVRESVHWGTPLTYPHNDPLPGLWEQYCYIFRAWDVPEGTTVTGDMTVTANYSIDAVATLGNGVAVIPVVNSTSITLEAGKLSVNLAGALTYAAETDRMLTVKWDALQISLEPEQVNALIKAGCDRIFFRSENQRDGSVLYTLTYRDSKGNDLSVAPAATVTPVTLTAGGEHFLFYRENGALAEARFQVSGGFALTARKGRQITVLPNSLCATAGLPVAGVPGSRVVIDTLCDYGYAVKGIKLTYADGRVENITGIEFTMPDSDVTMELVVEKIIYTIRFFVNGQLHHTAQYGLGEQIRAPQKPADYTDDTYAYTFLRWDPLPTLAMGEELVRDHHAVFSQNMLVGADDYRDFADNNRLFTLYLPIGIGAVLLAVAAVILLIVFRRRKKARLSVQAKLIAETREEAPAVEVSVEVQAEATLEDAPEDAPEETDTPEDHPKTPEN